MKRETVAIADIYVPVKRRATLEQKRVDEIAGQKMETYHEWMKGVLPITMSGCPALAAPAGFNEQGLPIGIQIVAPNHAELACLQLGYAYDAATAWPTRQPPRLLSETVMDKGGSID